MAFDLKLFSTKLLRCRNQLQIDLKELSNKIGIDENRLSNLEEGKAEPTGDEVLIFSDFYKLNYNYFISNQQKSASDEVDILYRKFGNEFSKEDRWAVKEFIFLCEAEDYITNKLTLGKVDFHFNPSGSFFKGHGADAANALRLKLGLKVEQIINDPYSTFRQLGIHIFRRKLSNSDISGLFISHPTAGKCVLINYEEDVYRQNFTLSHEIAHAIFDFKDAVNISFTKWTAGDLKEIRANSFASNFLIPKKLLSNLNAGSWSQDQFLNVAKQLKVNPEPLAIAMKECGLINENMYQVYKSLKIPLQEKLDPELQNLSSKFLQAKKTLLQKGLSSYYVRNAYECYNQGFISAGRLAEILLCNESELINLLQLFNLQLSYDN